MSAYITKLMRDAEQARAAAQPNDPLAPLKQRIDEWHSSLPAVSRARRFHMQEIVAGVGVAPRMLGPALSAAGWARSRHHSTRDTNARYWLPPGATEPHRRNG